MGDYDAREWDCLLRWLRGQGRDALADAIEDGVPAEMSDGAERDRAAFVLPPALWPDAARVMVAALAAARRSRSPRWGSPSPWRCGWRRGRRSEA